MAGPHCQPPSRIKMKISYGKFNIQLCALLCELLTLTVPKVVHADLAIQQGVPAGFETISKPRETRITLYYGGELLGAFPAHFAPGKIQFDRPADIIATIPTIIDQATVAAVLAQPLDAHADLQCNAKRTENCGTLNPDVTGIIFNDSRLDAELFVNKKFLSVTDQAGTRYLPLPERKFGAVNAFTGAIGGGSNGNNNFAVSDNATYSYGEMRFNTQSTLANDGVRFDTAAATLERNGWNDTAGLFRSQSMELLSDRDIAGISVSTSTRTLLDSRKTVGNSIIVFLPRRSFVSIYREGRLYSSQNYEAGNQTVDTSELPEGAYNITLRIQEPDGQIREERRFFAKNQNLPPAGQPVYYAQAGVIRKSASDDSALPELTSNILLRAGTVQRISDDMGLSQSFLGLSDRAVSETGLFWIHSGIEMRGTVLGSTRGDAGLQFGYLQNWNTFNMSLDARKLWNADAPIPGFDAYSQSNTQVTAGAGYTVSEKITVGARANYTQNNTMPSTKSIGPYVNWQIWQHGEGILNLRADAARNDNRDEGNILLSFSYRLGDYNISSTAGATCNAAGTAPNGNLRISHDSRAPGETLLVGAGTGTDSKQQIANADADWHNNFGQFRGSVQEAFGRTGNNFSYGGNFAFNIAQTTDSFHLGGDANGRSAVIIDTVGDADTDMTIFVNGAANSVVHAGQRQVIYLSPFHNYNIHLTSKNPGLYDYNNNDRRVTLYPGNVAKLSWEINKFYVVTGHVVDAEGAPLQNALLKDSKAQIATDDKGRLQAEIAAPHILVFNKKDNMQCQVTLPKLAAPKNGVLLYKEKLVCQ